MTESGSSGPGSVAPLISLNAVAFDTETTGLDTAKARILQIGAVMISEGRIDESRTFQQYVNPGEPIPAANSAIHGIYDSDLVDAAGFVPVKNDFDRFCGDALMIGYSSGYDLAMLRREQELANLPWQPPRTLDTRYLVNLVAPNLQDYSLDGIARWLGIELVDRHSALGDALSTAKIFLRLIPLLRERGIRTLAEAERACLQFSELSAREVSQGWQDVRRTASQMLAPRAVLERIDAYAYRHRLRELMNTPPVLVESGLILGEVLDLLIRQRISAVFVKPDADHAQTGIITERDLLRTINRQDDALSRLQAADIAQYPLQSLSQDAFVYRAIAKMRRNNIRHLGVHDSGGAIVGALSARDLLRQRADYAIALGDNIDRAQNSARMAEVWGQTALVASGLASEGVDGRDIAAVVSRELCALTRQACKLAEADMLEAGLGPAPCEYAMLVLGSGGRGESMLAMDQDNAIVYAQGEAGGEEDRWFADLGTRVSDMLDIAGVPYCKGNIMASNADWRHSLQQWQASIRTWIERQTPEDILNCDIFFDAVCVHGNTGLASQLLDFAFEQGAQRSSFLKLMAINACKHRVPIGLFGRFKLDEGRMDLKIGGIMPIFSCARVLAIQHRVRELSTPQRLSSTRKHQENMSKTFNNLDEAHRILFNAIFQQQLLDIQVGIPPSNRVAPASLAGSLRKQLKWALDQVSGVSNLLGDPLASV